jgi:ribosomal protein S18 acetylase RimI-like enzyme
MPDERRLPPPIAIRRVGPGDLEHVVAASALFDGPARRDATARFLAEPTHHLLLATEAGRPVGFVSGVETTHPDKGTEMFLYELAVEEGTRRRGIGRALVETLAALAVERGCYGMWVSTDADNEAAIRTYRAAGAGTPEPFVLLEWRFADRDAPED